MQASNASLGSEQSRLVVASICLLVTALTTSCTEGSEMKARGSKNLVVQAFEQLAERTPEDFYLTISDKASGKLIQFTGGKGEPLCVIMSEESLTKDELPRARVVFSDYGILAVAHSPSSFPVDDPSLSVEIFSGCLGNDYSVGPRLVDRFFRDVYLLPDDFEALIEED